MDDDRVIRYTTAPATEDRWGTESTHETLYRNRELDGAPAGLPYRRVAIRRAQVERQTDRYMAGRYACLSTEVFAEWVATGLVTARPPAGGPKV